MKKISLALKDGSNYEIGNDLIKKLDSIYGNKVDIIKELKKMQVWLLLNENNRKTRRGIKRFIANWLNKSYDTVPSYDTKPKVVNHNTILSKGYAVLNKDGLDVFDRWAADNNVTDYDKECIVNAVNGHYVVKLNKLKRGMFKE